MNWITTKLSAPLIIIMTYLGQLVAGNSQYIGYQVLTSATSGSQFFVQEPNWSDVTNSTRYIARNAFVKLVYTRSNHTNIKADANTPNPYWGVRYILTTTDVMTNQSKMDTLTIEHEQDTAIYEAMAVYPISGGKVLVNVTKVEARQGFGGAWTAFSTNVPSYLPSSEIELQVVINVDRYDYLSPTATTAANHFYTYSNTTPKANYINISWSYVVGMESSELEYVYWDALSTDNPGIQNPSKLFAHATRIETNAQNYKIDLTYPQGTLYYRIRPIGRHLGTPNNDMNYRKEGAWSSIGHVTVNAFESNKSWQYTTAFAEEGKSKKSISYFDESMRNRQSIVYLNDDQRTLVAETDYSVEGQQSIGILPVPASPQDNNLFFKAAFNVNGAGQPYSYLDFDKNTNADPLGDISGAGHYYSSANSFTNDLYRDYIPQDAYPLTQTKYTRDKTGRKTAQGGIGAFFQLGSQHETKYFYGSASDVELRRLFGSNVGNAQHYDKNMVIDANGQVAITYADQTGKTIATALAGRAPSNVEALASAGDIPITIDLIRNTTPANGCIEDESSILNVKEGTVYDFSYNLTGTYNSLQMRNISLCDACSYRLEITIRNTDDEYILPAGTVSGANKETIIQGSDTLYRISQNYTGQQLASCNTGTAYTTQSIDFQMTFDELGSYRINKRLCLVSEPLSALRQRLLTSGALPDSSAFIQAAYAQVDTTVCDILQELSSADAAQLMHQGAQQGCESSLLQLKEQVKPGNPYNSSTVALSLASNRSFVIEDVSGALFSIVGNTITNANSVVVPSITIEDRTNNTTYTITNQSTFQAALQTIGLWQSQWADVLVLDHREYCHYLDCQSLVVSRDYDFQLLQYKTWANAASNGLATYSNVLNADPILSNTRFSQCSLQTSMGALMNNFRQSGQSITQFCASVVSTLNTQSYGGNMTQAQQDTFAWTFFRGYYQNLRDSLLETCTACTWFADNNAVFERNPLRNIQTTAAANSWNSTQLESHCNQMCEAQVENWMQKITHEMRLCNTYWNTASSDYIYVREQLGLYCQNSCGMDNPLAAMLMEDVTTDPNLNNALSLINSNYFSALPAPCNTNWTTHLIQYTDSVYTYATNTDGSFVEVCLPRQTNTICINDLLDVFNNQVIGNTPISGGVDLNYYINVTNGCWKNITWLNVFDKFNQTGFTLSKCDYQFLWLNSIPNSTCGSINAPSNFDIVSLDSIRFVDTVGINNPCLSPLTPIWHLQYRYQNGNWTDIYLALSATGCGLDYEACDMTRIATLKNSSNDGFNVSWNSIHEACVNDLYAAAFAEGMNAWNAAIDSLLSQYMRTLNNCWLPPMNETFTASYMSSEYHYTLYYYDQAGNLVQTISPEGVRPLTIANGVWDGVSEPQHGLLVTYQFNTLGQTVKQTSPDAGTTVFYHDDLQRLRLSQNAEQAASSDYAFIKYDYLSRPVESGKLSGYNTLPSTSLFKTDINTMAFPSSNTSESTRTIYTTASGSYNQENLIGKVSYVRNDNITTYYSYDEVGNVKQLWHDIAGMGVVNLAYQYDLVSGKVNQVDYQKGNQDQFFHRYNYDADNRLRGVETSADGYIWNREAKYQYYVHGQLARVELGDKVAGNDFYHNLQGWILGANGMGEGEYHLGKDGQIANGAINRWVARDAYSYQLAYYHKHYSAIGGYADYGNIVDALISQTGSVPQGNTGQVGLYNGNISGMVTQVFDGILNGKVFAETFTYDQLHRIVGSTAGISVTSTDLTSFESFLDVNISNDFGSNYQYDANGNILNLGRSHLGRPIDDLSYTYNQLPSGMLENNRLKIIDDAVGGAGVGDLDAVAGGYTYDAIGRLIEDPSESIKYITWNIQNKVTRVQFTNGNPDVKYTYDAQGNRLMKDNGNTISFYVRDAQGNVLAIYEKTLSGMIQKEVQLYGTSRVGTWNTNRLMGALATRKFNYTRGHRTYEQSNHLGNVLATITDLAHGVDETADKIAEYYTATVRYASLYYPFGWEIPSLTYSATPDGNRYGFNGKENDKEWKIQDYGFRLYNQRIARFFSVDPLTQKYPELTPYQFASNTPIAAIDLDGLEAYFVHGTQATIFSKNGSERWTDDAVRQLMLLSENTSFDRSFDWTSGYLHGSVSRRIAARRLAHYVMSTMDINQGVITLIGHSHGGNVSIQAAELLRSEFENSEDPRIRALRINIITVGTPANGFDIETMDEAGDMGVNRHIHLYNEEDNVQVGAATLASGGAPFGRRFGENETTSNYVVGSGHSFDVESNAIQEAAPQILESEEIKTSIIQGRIRFNSNFSLTPTAEVESARARAAILLESRRNRRLIETRSTRTE